MSGENGHIIFDRIQWNFVNSKSLDQEDLYQSISFANYREVDIKIYSPKNDIIIIIIFLINICFGCVKETSQRDVSFTHLNHFF